MKSHYTKQLIFLVIISLFFLTCGERNIEITMSPEVISAYGVIERTVPGAEKHFLLEKIESKNPNDIFELESQGDKVIIRGTTGVAIASGFNYYLKNYCNAHISWCGKQVNLPENMPELDNKITIETPYQNRYYFNYCTFGYSMVFWDWERWEQEIDWMALQGINMPLAITGHETVMKKVYEKLNFTDQEIKEFISGPAYFAWFMMGNLDGFGGPLPDVWFEEQKVLQKKILERERALGMTPVLPAFTGHVPKAITKYYPEAEVKEMEPWNEFPGTYMLTGKDELFQKIGNLFMSESIEMYGTDHLYSADTFNELKPSSNDPQYLKEISEAVYTSMFDVDPEAIWVMQGWLFLDKEFWKQPQINGLLAGVPDDKMIILDLFSTAKPVWNRTNAYNGKPWIWNMLHNWGGKQGMYGRAQKMVEDLPSITKNPDKGNLCGIGLTPEGIEVNPVMFDLFGTLVWENNSIDLNTWITAYVKRRYGKDNPDLQKAWNILINTIYSCETKRHGPQGSYFAMRPTPDFSEGQFARAPIFYDVNRVREALWFFIKAAKEFKGEETFRYDLVDLTRQAMSDKAQEMLGELKEAYTEKNTPLFIEKSKKYLHAIKDLDEVLSSNEMFLLGNWLKKASDRAHNEEQLKLYEYNARNLITQWGPKDSLLKDYAQRQYGGMMGDFNYRRWKLFFDNVIVALHNNEKLDWETTNAKISDWEDEWANDTSKYPTEANTFSIEKIKNIFITYLND